MLVQPECLSTLLTGGARSKRTDTRGNSTERRTRVLTKDGKRSDTLGNNTDRRSKSTDRRGRSNNRGTRGLTKRDLVRPEGTRLLTGGALVPS